MGSANCSSAESRWRRATVSPAEYAALAAAHGLSPRTAEACRLVLVERLSQYAAARRAGMAPSTVLRALRQLARPVCRECGRPRTD